MRQRGKDSINCWGKYGATGILTHREFKMANHFENLYRSVLQMWVYEYLSSDHFCLCPTEISYVPSKLMYENIQSSSIHNIRKLDANTNVMDEPSNPSARLPKPVSHPRAIPASVVCLMLLFAIPSSFGHWGFPLLPYELRSSLKRLYLTAHPEHWVDFQQKCHQAT